MRIENKTVKAICGALIPAYIETLPVYHLNLPEVLEEPGQTLAQKQLREIRQAQHQDRVIDKWRIIDGKLPNISNAKEDLAMRKQFQNLRIKRGVLYRILHESETDIEQLVVPPCFREEILRGLQDIQDGKGPYA